MKCKVHTERLLAGVALLATACGGSTEPKSPPLLLDLPRALSANETRVSRAANQFAFTLFRRLNETQRDSNVFVSPLSVSFALGMTLNGANGTTFDEMRSTLGFGAAELGEINDGYRNFMSLEGGLDPTTTFRIANSVWYRQTLPVHQSFVDTVKRVFDAEVRASDFGAGTITQMNDWVSAKTNGKIPTIIDQIPDDLVMCLINAIYFKGTWRTQFDPAQTRDMQFNAAGGAQTVKTMHHVKGAIKLGSATGATVGELLYGNGAFVMTIVVPQDVNALAATLDTTAWTSLLGRLHETKADVYLPKLRLEYGRQMADDLKALGMNVPFIRDGADFTRMSPLGRQLYIQFVKHKTFVDVNEEGTEAAAVTNVGIGLTSLAPELRVDRPFIFAIRERFSGTILFIGKIVRIPA
jgi:serine protease inhibitor